MNEYSLCCGPLWECDCHREINTLSKQLAKWQAEDRLRYEIKKAVLQNEADVYHMNNPTRRVDHDARTAN